MTSNLPAERFGAGQISTTAAPASAPTHGKHAFRRLGHVSGWLLAAALASLWPCAASAQLEFDPTRILGHPPATPDAPAPVIEGLPDRVGHPILPVRGYVPSGTGGQLSLHLVVRGVPTPKVQRTARGRFCMELDLRQPGVYDIEFRNHDSNGTISPPTIKTIEYDPQAPDVGMLDCAGTRNLGLCTPSQEQCDNHIDDDCDGLTDQQDPDCDRACLDDVLELRDGSIPHLGYGFTEDLYLCGAGSGPDTDRYGVRVRAGHGLLIGLEILDLNPTDPTATLVIRAGGREARVDSTNPPADGLVMGLFPSEIDTADQPQNVLFEVHEAEGRPVHYRLYTDIVRIGPANDPGNDQDPPTEEDLTEEGEP